MQDIFFWRSWAKPYQWLYIFILGIFILLVFVFLYVYLLGPDNVLQWRIQSNIESVPYDMATFNKGLFEIKVTGYNGIITQKYLPTDWMYSVNANYAFGLILMLVWSIALAVISTFRSPLWFGIGTGIFILFLSYLGLNQLRGGSIPENTELIVSVLLFGGLSFMYHAYWRNTSIFLRWASYIFLWGVLILYVMTFSNQKYPLLYLTANTLPIAIILTMLFCFLIAHEIIFFFCFLITKYNALPVRSNTNIVHLIVISFLYLSNLSLLLFQEAGYIQWNIFFIDIFIIFIVSTILNIWGFKKRASDTIFFFTEDWQASLLQILWAILSISTLSYAFAVGNDSLVELFKYFFLISHITLGMVYLVYILINFIPLIKDGASVYTVIFQGKIFGFVTGQLWSLVALAFVFGNRLQILYYLGYGAYFTNLADVELYHQKTSLAKEYYQLATKYDYLSPHNRLILAQLDMQSNAPSEQLVHLQQSVQKAPLPYAYASLADAYQQRSLFFDAVFSLQKGVRNFPKQSELYNNLALLYADLQDERDSTVLLFQKANNLAKNSTALNNLWAFLAKNYIKNVKPDSLLSKKPQPKGLEEGINQLAMYNTYGAYYNVPLQKQWLNQKQLSMYQLNYLLNHTLNRSGYSDSTSLVFINQYLIQHPESTFKDQLLFAKAVYLYYNENVREAIQIFNQISALQGDAYFNRLMGIWLLEQDLHYWSADFLRKAISLKDPKADVLLAICLSEDSKPLEALTQWGKIFKEQDSTRRSNPTIKVVLKVLENYKDNKMQWNGDAEKFAFIHYAKNLVPVERLDEEWKLISNTDYKAWAAAELAHLYMSKGELNKAQLILNSSVVNKQSPAIVRSAFQLAVLYLYMYQNQNTNLLDIIDKVDLIKPLKSQKFYLKAMAYQNMGDLDKAEMYFLKAYQSCPYNQEILLRTAEFFDYYKKDVERAYKILAEAVQTYPGNLDLFKAYTLQALKLNLFGYADSGLETVKKIAKGSDLSEFIREYNSIKKAQEDKINSFSR